MRIGVPPSSVNCLLAAGFLPRAPGAEAMRVPRPAAGMIATTFIAGCKYTRAEESVQIGRLGECRVCGRYFSSYSPGRSTITGDVFFGSAFEIGVAVVTTAAGRGSG